MRHTFILEVLVVIIRESVPSNFEYVPPRILNYIASVLDNPLLVPTIERRLQWLVFQLWNMIRGLF